MVHGRWIRVVWATSCRSEFPPRLVTGLAVTQETESVCIGRLKRAVIHYICIDLSRAFDTLSHDILLKKLYKYGIRGSAWNWVKSYLSNRKQYVSYGSEKSDTGNIEIGVPQGSILGPLLFLLYINDLCDVSHRVSFIQFADDTSIYCTGSSLESPGGVSI